MFKKNQNRIYEHCRWSRKAKIKNFSIDIVLIINLAVGGARVQQHVQDGVIGELSEHWDGPKRDGLETLVDAVSIRVQRFVP